MFNNLLKIKRFHKFTMNSNIGQTLRDMSLKGQISWGRITPSENKAEACLYFPVGLFRNEA